MLLRARAKRAAILVLTSWPTQLIASGAHVRPALPLQQLPAASWCCRGAAPTQRPAAGSQQMYYMLLQVLQL